MQSLRGEVSSAHPQLIEIQDVRLSSCPVRQGFSEITMTMDSNKARHKQDM